MRPFFVIQLFTLRRYFKYIWTSAIAIQFVETAIKFSFIRKDCEREIKSNFYCNFDKVINIYACNKNNRNRARTRDFLLNFLSFSHSLSLPSSHNWRFRRWHLIVLQKAHVERNIHGREGQFVKFTIKCKQKKRHHHNG